MTLKDERTKVVQALTAAGIRAYNHIPERITPPVATVSAGNPYVEDGDTFGEYLVRLHVRVVAEKKTNEVMTDNVDDLIAAAIEALDGWSIEGAFIYEWEIGGQPYLTAVLDITTHIIELGGSN
jgi:hypothetical protein